MSFNIPIQRISRVHSSRLVTRYTHAIFTGMTPRWCASAIPTKQRNRNEVSKVRKKNDSVVNFLILNSVTQQIIELTKEYSQIKGTKVSFLKVFQSDQLHRTARKQIKNTRLLSACLFGCLYVYFLGWKQLSFTSKVFMLVWGGGNRIKVQRHGIWFFLTQHNFFSENCNRFATKLLLKRENIPLWT